MVWRECQDKIKFSLIVSYNAAFNQKMLVINNRQEEVSIRQQVLYMLTDGRDQIKQATKLVLELVMIMASKLR
jgi:hypothetical protein